MSAEGAVPVRLTLAVDLANVRVARLVAATTARGLGLPEPVVDDVRLAVGEACGRAVLAQLDAGVEEPVVVELWADAPDGGLRVDVVDADPPGPATPGTVRAGITMDDPVVTADGVLVVDAVALVRGLADSSEVQERPDGTTLSLRWDPPTGVAAAP